MEQKPWPSKFNFVLKLPIKQSGSTSIYTRQVEIYSYDRDRFIVIFDYYLLVRVYVGLSTRTYNKTIAKHRKTRLNSVRLASQRYAAMAGEPLSIFSLSIPDLNLRRTFGQKFFNKFGCVTLDHVVRILKFRCDVDVSPTNPEKLTTKFRFPAASRTNQGRNQIARRRKATGKTSRIPAYRVFRFKFTTEKLQIEQHK